MPSRMVQHVTSPFVMSTRAGSKSVASNLVGTPDEILLSNVPPFSTWPLLISTDVTVGATFVA